MYIYRSSHMAYALLQILHIWYPTDILRDSGQNGISLLYIMLEIHHSGQEPSIFITHAIWFQIHSLHIWYLKDTFIRHYMVAYRSRQRKASPDILVCVVPKAQSRITLAFLHSGSFAKRNGERGRGDRKRVEKKGGGENVCFHVCEEGRGTERETDLAQVTAIGLSNVCYIGFNV